MKKSYYLKKMQKGVKIKNLNREITSKYVN